MEQLKPKYEASAIVTLISVVLFRMVHSVGFQRVSNSKNRGILYNTKIDEGQKSTHLLRSPEAEKNVRPVSFDGCRTGIPDEMAATAKLYDGPKFQK